MTNKILWFADELINALDGTLIGGTLQAANGISIDSRDVAKDDVFFAIKGDLFDGHDYAIKAAQTGAAVIVISDEKYRPNLDNVATILVDDVLASLGRLAVAARKRCNGKIIAITGSVGKTSTKEFLRFCLEKCGRTHASIKSFNNHWGVPISLARMPRDTEYGIFEIGMNHLNEISPLVQMVMPDIAIITTIAPAHLGFFKDLAEIALAKSEIFDGMDENGIVVLNRDNEFYDFLRTKAEQKGINKIVSFGGSMKATIRLIDAKILPNFSIVKARYDNQEFEYIIGSAGMHQVQNSLGLLMIVKLLGIKLNSILSILENVELSDGRGVQSELPIDGGTFKLIDESYNANPASMVAAFSVLSAQNTVGDGKKIAIIGDMLELGDNAPQMHASLAKEIIDANLDMVMTCGKYMKYCYDSLPIEKRGAYGINSSQLAKNILNKINANDVVMVKGSLGSKMSIIISKLKENL